MDPTFFPKVSIIIPVYNGANYMREAIDSALSQTYENVEVIVVNDGSCDEGATRAVALSYGEAIRYFEKENGGVSSALNFGIRQMTGEYMSWLSHDDKYEPEKVARSVARLASFEDRERLVAFCGAYYINERGERLRSLRVQLPSKSVCSGVDILWYMLSHDMLNACCMLIPKSAFETCGYFNEDLRYNQDALMMYQIFGGGYDMVADTAHEDVMYRLHATQTSKTRRDLLLRDSVALAKIIAPLFARQSTKERPLLRLFAKRNAKHRCADAVRECVCVGKDTGVFHGGDVWYLRLWLCVGAVRNALKQMRNRLVFKI